MKKTKKSKAKKRVTCCCCSNLGVFGMVFNSDNFEISLLFCEPCARNIQANYAQIDNLGSIHPTSVVIYLLSGQLEVVQNKKDSSLTTETSRPGTPLN